MGEIPLTSPEEPKNIGVGTSSKNASVPSRLKNAVNPSTVDNSGNMAVRASSPDSLNPKTVASEPGARGAGLLWKLAALTTPPEKTSGGSNPSDTTNPLVLAETVSAAFAATTVILTGPDAGGDHLPP